MRRRKGYTCGRIEEEIYSDFRRKTQQNYDARVLPAESFKPTYFNSYRRARHAVGGRFFVKTEVFLLTMRRKLNPNRTQRCLIHYLERTCSSTYSGNVRWIGAEREAKQKVHVRNISVVIQIDIFSRVHSLQHANENSPNDDFQVSLPSFEAGRSNRYFARLPSQLKVLGRMRAAWSNPAWASRRIYAPCIERLGRAVILAVCPCHTEPL